MLSPLVKASAEAWFTAGALTIAEQRVRGFGALKNYLPKEAKEPALHEAWTRYGAPYEGARRTAGRAEAADFLVKAYVAIALRLVASQGWPQPADMSAQIAIGAVVAVAERDGDELSLYDIQTIEMKLAERARFEKAEEAERVRRNWAEYGMRAQRNWDEYEEDRNNKERERLIRERNPESATILKGRLALDTTRRLPQKVSLYALLYLAAGAAIVGLLARAFH